MTRLLPLVMLLAACGGEPGAVREYRAQAEDKNVVMVLLDAAAWAHFSYNGYPRETSPNIDRLAAESVIFDHAYAPSASTGHSVYGLLTSLHSFLAEEAGLRGEREAAFRVTETTQLMPELLAPRFAHRSGISGNAWFGPEFGFDRGFTHFTASWRNEDVPDTTKRHGGRILDLFLQDLEQWGDAPAFSYVHFLEPHTPYTPPERFARRFHPAAIDSVDTGARSMLNLRLAPPSMRDQEMIVALYDANIAYVDSLVGEVVSALQEAEKWDDTIFILVADHGEAFWQHGVSGHGRHIYDEMVKIPMLVRLPGVEGLAGTRIQQPVGLKDLLPTYLDLLQLEIPEHLEGDTLLPLIAGDTAAYAERVVFLRGTHGNNPEFGLRYGRHKWIYRVHEGTYELYDVVSDPGETVDLSEGDVDPELLEVRKLIAFWIARGTGRVDPVEDMDPEIEAKLKAIGYF